MKSVFALIPFIILLTGCDAADFRDVRSASLKLQQGMTEAEAINVIGFPPDTAELGTCGTDSKHGSWTCRTLTFNSLGDKHRLMILEQSIGGVWRVNSWSLL